MNREGGWLLEPVGYIYDPGGCLLLEVSSVCCGLHVFSDS